MEIAFALLSASVYGVVSFLGGVMSRRSSAWQIAVVSQLSAAVLLVAVALMTEGDSTARVVGFAAAGGVCSGFGSAFLYVGLSTGRMGVVTPLSAVGGALVPLAVAVCQGDRISGLAVTGVMCAFPAIWLIARNADSDSASSGGMVHGMLAGLGYGGLFACLGEVPESAGFAPLAVTQVFSVFGVILTATALSQAWVPRDRQAARALLLGPLSAIGTGAFLLATHHGMLSIVSVITALYPAMTVLLAALVLRERIRMRQGVGLALAVGAISLVIIG